MCNHGCPNIVLFFLLCNSILKSSLQNLISSRYCLKQVGFIFMFRERLYPMIFLKINRENFRIKQHEAVMSEVMSCLLATIRKEKSVQT